MPIPPLQPRYDSSVSIIFVNSQGILYSEPSDDPIFPVSKPFDFGFDIGIKYSKASQADTVLGCVDSTKWRIRDISDTWYERSGRDQNGKYFNPDWLEKVSSQSRGGMRLLLKSLVFSRTGMNIQSRKGTGLAASKLLQSGYSYKIAKEQWKEEARQLFETSLARILISARDFAQGAGAKYGLQRNEKGRAEFCDNNFLFKSQGWRNIHTAGSVWTLLCSVAVVLMAVPLDDERLVAESIWPALCALATLIRVKLPAIYRKVNLWAWVVRLGMSRILLRWKHRG